MIRAMIKEDIKRIMRRCDEDLEREFLDEFGAYRRKIVYQSKVVTEDEFDEICKEVLEEVEDD